MDINKRRGFRRVGILLTVAVGGLFGVFRVNAQSAGGGKTTVLWISMDGTRADYLDRKSLPFFARLMKEGAYSKKFRPVFPPITFPSHCSEATGVAVDKHGVTGNGFYDTKTQTAYRFPADASLLQAEPIWLTAKRQGVRTLVFDWPLSQKETMPGHADYFKDKFDNDVSDEQRMNDLLETWHTDAAGGMAGGGLRLLMGYVEGTDPVGHKYGPDAPEIGEEMTKLDGILGAFFDRALAQWKEHAGAADRLYVLFTTDHGMSAVQKSVNLEKTLDLIHGQTEVTLQTTGNVGSIFLDKIPAGEAREKQAATFLAKLKALPFAKAWRREELPKTWAYAHPTRTGDMVVVLEKGYTFGSGVGEGPKGMHGYPVEDDPEMYGVTFVWRYPQLIGGKDLGEVNWDQYHPSVAKWLGVQPAEGAEGKALRLPGE